MHVNALGRRFLAMLAVLWLGLTSALAQQDAAKQWKQLTDRELIEIANEVQRDVEELRGWKFKKPVKKGVYTQEKLRRFVENAIDEEYGGGRLERLEAMLRITGTIPPDCELRKTLMDVLMEQIGGFYDPKTSAFYMMNREGFGPLMNRVLIAHELTHALDDQYTDLEALLYGRKMTEDETAAVACVVEGSATVLMSRYLMKAQASGRFDPAELAEAMQSEMQRMDSITGAPRYFATIIANYMAGMSFLLRADMQKIADTTPAGSVGDELLKAAKNPPRSTEQVLHPEKYWNRAARDEPVRVDDEAVEAALQLKGFHVIERNCLGELLCAVVTTDPAQTLNPMMMGLPGYWTNDAAAGWGGDRFYLLAEGADTAAAEKSLKNLRGLWVTAWDTADDRREFVEDYELYREMSKRRRIDIGRRVAVYLFNFTDDEGRAIEESLASKTPAFTQAEKPWAPGAEK